MTLAALLKAEKTTDASVCEFFASLSASVSEEAVIQKLSFFANKKQNLDSAAETVIQAKFQRAAQLMFRHALLINEATAVRLIDAFPSLLPALLINFRSFGVSALTAAARTHLSEATAVSFVRQVIELIECHEVMGADLPKKFPALPDIVAFATVLVDGRFLAWLSAGCPQELELLQTVVARLKTDLQAELKLLALMHGVAAQQRAPLKSAAVLGSS